jgi:hypothetical protein
LLVTRHPPPRPRSLWPYSALRPSACDLCRVALNSPKLNSAKENRRDHGPDGAGPYRILNLL